MKSTGKVTVKDIARRLGVSLSTVNKPLTGKPGISEKRRGEVILAAKEMGYMVNHVAQSLSRKPMKIGIVMPSGWQQYFAPIGEGMKLELEKLEQSGVSGEFLPIGSADQIVPAFEKLKAARVDLIIYCPSLFEISAEASACIAGLGIPLMLAGAECEQLHSVCTVSIDSELSGRIAADFLSIPLRGSGKVAVLLGSKKLDTHVSKAFAFIERACALGMSVTGIYETGDEAEIISACMKRVYDQHPDLGGIYVATGSIVRVAEFFSAVPKEKRPFIVATDIGEDVRRAMMRAEITAAVFQNQALMGRLSVAYAYEYLVKASSYRDSPGTVPKRIYVSPHLFLPSDLDRFGEDDGNDYRIEN